MEEPAKETIIIVHGTWAAQETGVRKWYEPHEDCEASEGFVAKLDSALRERGSPARCWAHCHGSIQIFSWSGDNSWIARTNAALALADYVTALTKDKWLCHFIAHSHGGNVIVEALPRLLSGKESKCVGRIVTLGTPFIDTSTWINTQSVRAKKKRKNNIWGSFILVSMFSLAGVYYAGWIGTPIILVVAVLSYALSRRLKQFNAKTSAIALSEPIIMAINTPVDEAWQSLFHVRNSKNPLAPDPNWIKYLFASYLGNVRRGDEIGRISGEKRLSETQNSTKIAVAIFCLPILCLILISSAYVLPDVLFNSRIGEVNEKSADMITTVYYILNSVLSTLSAVVVLIIIPTVYLTTSIIGEEFIVTIATTFSRLTRRIIALTSILNDSVTYVIRNSAWTVLQKIILGLEGYQHEIPVVDTRPHSIPENLVKLESMPKGAEERALATRNTWIVRHSADVSQTFAKMAVTASDVSSLMKRIEEDATLVHGAYYSDDECIAQIANWIARKSLVEGEQRDS